MLDVADVRDLMTAELWEVELGAALRGTGWTVTWPRVDASGATAYAIAIHPETGRRTQLSVTCDFSTTKASRRLEIFRQLGING
jgi:hypothetical protein